MEADYKKAGFTRVVEDGREILYITPRIYAGPTSRVTTRYEIIDKAILNIRKSLIYDTPNHFILSKVVRLFLDESTIKKGAGIRNVIFKGASDSEYVWENVPNAVGVVKYIEQLLSGSSADHQKKSDNNEEQSTPTNASSEDRNELTYKKALELFNYESDEEMTVQDLRLRLHDWRRQNPLLSEDNEYYILMTKGYYVLQGKIDPTTSTPPYLDANKYKDEETDQYLEESHERILLAQEQADQKVRDWREAQKLLRASKPVVWPPLPIPESVDPSSLKWADKMRQESNEKKREKLAHVMEAFQPLTPAEREDQAIVDCLNEFHHCDEILPGFAGKDYEFGWALDGLHKAASEIIRIRREFARNQAYKQRKQREEEASTEQPHSAKKPRKDAPRESEEPDSPDMTQKEARLLLEYGDTETINQDELTRRYWTYKKNSLYANLQYELKTAYQILLTIST